MPKHKKTAAEIGEEMAVFVANRDSLGEQTRPEEQPGAVVRDHLITMRDAQLDLKPHYPLIRIRREHDGD